MHRRIAKAWVSSWIPLAWCSFGALLVVSLMHMCSAALFTPLPPSIRRRVALLIAILPALFGLYVEPLDCEAVVAAARRMERTCALRLSRSMLWLRLGVATSRDLMHVDMGKHGVRRAQRSSEASSAPCRTRPPPSASDTCVSQQRFSDPWHRKGHRLEVLATLSHPFAVGVPSDPARESSLARVRSLAGVGTRRSQVARR